MESKLCVEWENLEALKQIKYDEENLGDEMRDDSVLRQTTSKAVNLVSHWLNPKREQQLSTKKSIVNGAHLSDPDQQTMRQFLLSNMEILAPLLSFIASAMAFKDMKSSSTLTQTALRSMSSSGTT